MMMMSESEQTWRNSFRWTNLMDGGRQVDERDDTVREMALTLLHHSGDTSSRKRWALMVQYDVDGDNVRYIYKIEAEQDKIVPVRTNYVAAEWRFKFLGLAHLSPKHLVDLVLQNKMNGRILKRKSCKKWTQELLRLINEQFLDEQFWDKTNFEDLRAISRDERSEQVEEKADDDSCVSKLHELHDVQFGGNNVCNGTATTHVTLDVADRLMTVRKFWNDGRVTLQEIGWTLDEGLPFDELRLALLKQES
jgi:hypothetical protein